MSRTPAFDRKALAALLYAGPRSALSGLALRQHGVRAPGLPWWTCWVPRATRRQDAGFARLRAALAEAADGIRSSAEADLRWLIKRVRPVSGEVTAVCGGGGGRRCSPRP